MKLKGHIKSLRASIKMFLVGGIAVALIMWLMGCAGSPVKRLEVFSVDKVTVFCSDNMFIKTAFARAGGDPKHYNTVYAFYDPRFRHVYIPCVEIDGLLMPECQNALGHEIWHLINHAYPKTTMNPDDWRAR